MESCIFFPFSTFAASLRSSILELVHEPIKILSSLMSTIAVFSFKSIYFRALIKSPFLLSLIDSESGMDWLIPATISSIVVWSTATIPDLAPASIAILHKVIRPSIVKFLIASPVNSIA